MTKKVIANAFSAAAKLYDRAAAIEQEIGQRLLERLSLVNLTPKHILDLGCGTGYFTRKLQKLFPAAYITGIDLAFNMVKFAKLKDDDIYYYCADAEQLPFANQTFDLIFSNCCFMYIRDLTNLCAEIHRVIKSDGGLFFSTLGPDSLKELAVEAPWLDMHYYGDALLQTQFRDPVVDVELIKFYYADSNELFSDLRETGAYDIPTDYALDKPELTVTIEAIYGYALGANKLLQQRKDQAGNILIPVESIKCL